MSKYSQGRYLIYLFNELGTRLRTVIPDEDNYSGAVAKGELLTRPERSADSFVVIRVLYNSKEQHDRSQ